MKHTASIQRRLSLRSLTLTSVAVALMLAAACEGGSVTGPDETPITKPPAGTPIPLSAFLCQATPGARTLSCAEADPLTTNYGLGVEWQQTAPRQAILIGGQHINVDVISSNITNDATTRHFGFDVAIRNLRPQPIGTTDGVTTDSSLTIFFHSGPTTTSGSGQVTVFNPTGVDAFTSGGQPYYKYPERLVQNQTSASKNWILAYDPAVETFAFQLLISANVQHPNGYIDVFASSNSVVTGGTLQMQDSVRDALGVVTADQSETWSLSSPVDSTKATISSSGLLTGVTPGSVTVVATQGAKTGTMVVTITGAAPDAKNDAFTTLTSASSLSGDVTADNGSGADILGSPPATVTSFGGGSLGGTVTSNAAGASVSLAGGNLTVNSNGAFTLTGATTAGTYTFQYRLTNAVTTDDATVTIVVRRLPDAKDDAFTMNTATTLNGNLTSDNGSGADDPGDPAATVTGFGGGSLAGNTTTNAAGASVALAGGTLTVNANGAISLTNPTTGGTYTFRYRLTNTAGADSATVTINVNAAPLAVNDAPANNTTVPGNPWHTAFNTVLSSPSVTANDNLGFPAATVTSFGGGTLLGTVTSNAAGTTATVDGHSLTINANGSFTYTPKTGFTGLFTTSYRISNAGGSSDATLTIAVGVRPAATNSTYGTTLPGNVGINTSTSTNTKVNAAGDALTYNLVSVLHGTASIHADGTFDYKPNVGYTGSETITYNVSNGFGATSNATVGLTIGSARIWFVADSASGTGDGRYGSPLKCFVGATNCLSGVTVNSGDVVHIAPGTYANTGAFTLPANVKLIGQGASVPFASAAGVTWPADAGSQPGTAGARPLINSAGATVFTLGAGNTIRGLTIGSTTGVALSGSAVGTMTIADAAINNPLGRAIDLTTSGTLAVTLDSIVATGGTGNGINIANQAGTFSSGVTKIRNPSGTGINVQNSSGFSFGTTRVTKTNAGTGVNLLTNTGTTTFTSLVDSTSAGAGLVTSGAGTLTISDGHIAAVGGSAINVTNTTFNATLDSVRTSGGPTQGVLFSGSTVNANLGTGSLSAGTEAFSATNTSGTVSYAGSISGSNRPVSIANASLGVCPTVTLSGSISAASNGILVQRCNTGTITFSGTKTLKTGANIGVQLLTNTGATINFTNGGLVDSTTTGNAFDVQGGGTVTVTGANNILRSTTGVALYVENTTIGANGLTFASISANGGNNGIVLSNTGSSGGLTVTGDGTNTSKGGNGSGGTISNATGADGAVAGIAVYLNNTANVVLRRMTINGTNQNGGIRGLGVTNFTFQYGTVTGTNGTTNVGEEAAIAFGKSNPSGANGFGNGSVATIDNAIINGAVEHNVEVYNQSNSFTFNVTNSDVKSNSVALGSDGILIEMQGTAAATALIQNVAFDNNKSQAVQGAANDNSSLNITITGSTIQRTSQGNEGIVLSNGSNGDLTAHVTNNTITGIGGVQIFVGQTPGNATSGSNLIAVVSGNNLTQPTSATNHAIIGFLTSTAGQVSNANLLVQNNTIANNATTGIARGILIDTPDANTSPSFTASVLSNAVSIGDNVNGVAGIVVQARRGAGCFDVRSNTTTFPNGAPPGVSGLRVRQTQPDGTATAQLERGVSGSNTPLTVLAANNPSATSEVLGTVSVVENTVCQAPPP